MRRAWATVVAILALGTTSAGCGLAAQNVPLPGKGVSGDTYRMQAVFPDALNLTEGAPVRLNGATVGQVQGVSVENYTAKVDMVVRTTAKLHDGAAARLRGTTPLGELYVDLTDGTSPTMLSDGATLSDGTVAPTIEDTMATTSLFLNGGGVTELGTIIRESNLALGGREATARDVLQRIDRTTGELTASMDDIDAALRSLSSLSATLHERRARIRAALEEVAPTARALRAQIEDLAALLSHVEKFGNTTSSVIATVQDDLVRSARQMGPIFDQMNAIEDDLTPAIQDLVRFARLLDDATPTQYLNTDLHIHLGQVPSLSSAMQSELAQRAESKQQAPSGPAGVAVPKIEVPAVPQVQRLIDPKPLVDQLNRLLKGSQR